MAGRGRPRKPTELKKLDGSFRYDRENQPPLPGEAPEFPTIPDYLGKYGLEFYEEYYHQLRELKVLKSTDLDSFFYLCHIREQLRICDDTIAKEGVTVETERGNFTRHPSAVHRDRIAPEYFKLLTHFGLTPSSRSGLNVSESSKDESVGFAPRSREAR
jgi:P27 family predicted phage terminase small subunit